MAKIIWTCRIHNQTFSSKFWANRHVTSWKVKGVQCALFGKQQK